LEKFKLNELGYVNRGRSRHRPRNDSTLFGGRYPFVQTGDVKAANFFLKDFNETYNEKGLAQSKLWPKGTLLITIAANIAETAILEIESCFPDSILGFTPFEGVSDVRYIKYFFDYIKLKLQAISQGTTQDNMSLDKLMSMPFEVHSYGQQKIVAIILSAYDELIANNSQRIKLLEEMAEEIYKEWFVRLRFPGHEQTRIVDGLPEGWFHGKLGELLVINMGQSPKSEFYNAIAEGLPFHQGVKDFCERFPEHITHCTDTKRVAEEGDILLSVRAPVGRLNIADQKIIIGRGLCAIRHKNHCQSFCYYLLRHVFQIEDAFGNGAVFNAVSKTEIANIKIAIPLKKIIEKFNELIEPIDSELLTLTQKNKILKQTRDLLLPRLMSGRLAIDHLPEP